MYAWQHRNDDSFSWSGLAKASGQGAIIGIGAGLLMPAAGAGAATYLGLQGGAATATSMAVNAAVGAGYTYATNTILCRPTTPTDLFIGVFGGALAGLGGLPAAAARPKVGAGGGWQTIDEVAGGAEGQLTEVSCGSACASMLGGSKVTQQQLIDAGYERMPSSTIAGKLTQITGEEWRGGDLDEIGVDVLSRQVGSWAAQLYDRGKMHHLVVVDKMLDNGNLLIRDPWNGGSVYQMTRAEFDRVWTGYGFFRMPG